MGEKVIALHGLGRSSYSMRGIARHLTRAGFNVANLDYPSTTLPIDQLVDQIHPHITAFAGEDTIHIVAHSMGGLLTRAYLTRYPATNIGRVVMLGTPNHGSEVTDFLKNWRLYRWFFGPAGQQLGTDQPVVHLFAPVHYPLGIIAGDWALDFVCGNIIGAPNDGKVSVESTKLDGMSAHLLLPVSHLSMLYQRSVRNHIVTFLKTGSF